MALGDSFNQQAYINQMISSGVINPNQYTGVANNTSYSYPQQAYVPPPVWASFPCGHQMKLEPGQPQPQRCQVCPAPERVHHEYKKCGHVYNYEKGQTIPSECPTCAFQKAQAETAAKERVEALEAELERRALEDKDPLAWLEKQVSAVREVAFA